MPYRLETALEGIYIFYLVMAKRFLEGNDECSLSTPDVGDAGIFKDDALVTQLSTRSTSIPCVPVSRTACALVQS